MAGVKVDLGVGREVADGVTSGRGRSRSSASYPTTTSLPTIRGNCVSATWVCAHSHLHTIFYTKFTGLFLYSQPCTEPYSTSATLTPSPAPTTTSSPASSPTSTISASLHFALPPAIIQDLHHQLWPFSPSCTSTPQDSTI